MRRLFMLVVAVALLGLFFPAHAQQQTRTQPPSQQSNSSKHRQLSDRERAAVQRRLTRLTHALNLTTKQQGKIRTILERAALEFRATGHKRPEDMSPQERQQFREKIRTQREQTNKQIEKVLDKDQLRKFREMLARQKHRRHRSLQRRPR